MELPFDPAILLLGLYPMNPETPIQKNLCTPMFIEAQFTRVFFNQIFKDNYNPKLAKTHDLQ